MEDNKLSNLNELQNDMKKFIKSNKEQNNIYQTTESIKEQNNIYQTTEPIKEQNDNPVFIDTQGNVKYNEKQDFFEYETSMNIQWNNKEARKMLIYLIDKFNTPLIMFLKHDGLALWNNTHLKNMMLYKRPVLFNEILIRDHYEHNNSLNNYPFLSVYYYVKLNDIYKSNLSNLQDYFVYDSFKNLLEVKSKTLEENMIMLYIFLYKNIKSTDNFLKIKKEYIKKLKSNPDTFAKEIRNYIKDINIKLNKYVSSIK